MNSVAWAAGLFEGEGCIHVRRQKTGGSTTLVIMTLVMTDEDVVRRFRDVVSCGSEIKQRQIRQFKPRFEWRCGKRDDVERLMSLFEPYLGNRRRQKICDARQALSDRTERRRGQIHHNAKLNAEEARQIAVESKSFSKAGLCRKYGIGRRTLDRVISGTHWSLR